MTEDADMAVDCPARSRLFVLAVVALGMLLFGGGCGRGTVSTTETPSSSRAHRLGIMLGSSEAV